MERKILDLLNKVLLGESTDLDKNHLFEIFIEVSRIRIRFFSRLKYFSLERNEISMDDIALESVTNLLSSSESDYLQYLRRSFLNWDPPITTEEEAFSYIGKIIDQSIYQTIARKYAELDPLFARILKEIKRADRKTYKIFNRVDTDYIALKELDENEELNIIPQDELILLGVINFPEKNYIKGWIDEIFNSINSLTEYMPVLPVNSLALKIKYELTAAQKINVSVALDPEFQYVLREGILISLNKVERKIERLANKKARYNEKTVAIFKEALNDIAMDLLEGDKIKNYFEYLKTYDKNLTQKDYRENYRAQFEYLIKLLKNELAQYYMQL